MRYVEGTDLGAVIAAAGRVPLPRAVQILAQLTAALDAAHARGLVHRDVKPANVLIAPEGGQDHVYLTDFGLAKLAAGGGYTRTGVFVGTLHYAAPEQLEAGRVDARTDVYAAGCVLYHMLTGSVPFQRDNDAAAMWAHMSAEPPSARAVVPALPAELDEVIARAMAKKPDDRYPSAGDLGRAALAAAAGQHATVLERTVATGAAAPTNVAAPTVSESRARTSPASARGLRTRTAAFAGAILAVVALVAVAVSGVFGGGNHPPAAGTRSPTSSPAVPSRPGHDELRELCTRTRIQLPS